MIRRMSLWLFTVTCGVFLASSLRAQTSDKNQRLSVTEEEIKPPFTTDETALSLTKDPIKKMPLSGVLGDSCWEFYTKLRIDGLYANNLKFLNHENNIKSPILDRILIPGRHTLDFNFQYIYGRASHRCDVLVFKSTIRNKANWGAPEIFATSFTGIRHLEATSGEHFHFLPRHLLWIRELWLEISINDILGLTCEPKHRLTMGYFPFELGRGIALGSAYGVDPDFIGYYSPNAIDQFAPGFKISGDLWKKYNIKYDIYAEIALNRADTLDNIAERVRTQIVGSRFDPARGFGKINYIIAGRLFWLPFTEPGKKLSFEPYALFTEQREQKIEFIGDAHSKLGTLGLAVEAEFGNWEFGFDTAFNVGNQEVKKRDRNTIIEEIRDGADFFVNSHVLATDHALEPDKPGEKAIFKKERQEVINNAPQDTEHNAKKIPEYGHDHIKNAEHRFTDSYCNTFHGAMFVGDISYWLYKRALKLAVTAGFATGDDHPNKDHKDLHDSHEDKKFKGFISLQELYTGLRVKSAFFLSGSGKVPRLLSVPVGKLDDHFPTVVVRFMNLIFTGAGLYFKLPAGKYPFEVNPNILAYWQYAPTRRFDLLEADAHSDHKRASPVKTAGKFLGTELNLFAERLLLDDLKFFFVGSLFIPGSHFRDMRHVPLNKAQEKYIEYLDGGKNNIEKDKRKPAERVAILGHDPAFTLSIGVEYKF